MNLLNLVKIANLEIGMILENGLRIIDIQKFTLVTVVYTEESSMVLDNEDYIEIS